MKNKIILRTHYWDEHVEAIASNLSLVENFDFAIVSDNFSRDVKISGEFINIRLTQEFINEQKLPRADKLGWVCGDYSFYAAHIYWGNYEYIWIVEPDVHFDFKDISDFFNYYKSSSDDLIAPFFGRRGEEWYWYGAAESALGEPVYGCFFPLVRLSKGAIEFLLEKRRLIKAPAKEPLFPNDESFVSTALSQAGFRCRDINDFGGEFLDYSIFNNYLPYQFGESRLNQCNNKVYHPVLSSKQILKKIGSIISRDNISELQALNSRLTEIDSATSDALDQIKSQLEERILKLKNTIVPARMTGSVITLSARSSIHIFVGDVNDYIQSVQFAGRFYEEEDLGVLSRYVNLRRRALDVGAHTGNHTLYFAKILGFEKVNAIEPLRCAQDILKLNVSINGLLERVELDYLQFGLGESACRGVLEFCQTNWGVSSIRQATPADTTSQCVSVVPGDNIFSEEVFDLVKIDVPNRVIPILRGLSKTIGRSECVLYLSVEASESPQIEGFLQEWGFELVYTANRYDSQRNLIFRPSQTRRTAA
jgi:FkbM family methyltransferase